MTAWWCQHGADYTVVGALDEGTARGVARHRFANADRVSMRERIAAYRHIDATGGITVRTATPADLAIWADHLASLDPAPADHEEPML